MRAAAIIVSGGSGSRMGRPKQFLPLSGSTVAEWSLKCFVEMAEVESVVLVLGEDSFKEHGKRLSGGKVTVVTAGPTRMGSVRNGFAALPKGVEVVAVHDGARSMITPEIVRATFAEAAKSGAAVAAVPVKDTLKVVEKGGKTVAETPERARFWAAQTPQTYRYSILKEALEKFAGDADATDESQLVERCGHKVSVVESSYENFKITTPEDITMATAIIEARQGGRRESRTGFGYDIHKLVEGRELWLAGIKLPHNKGLLGHSDGDAVLHACCDAVLGALGLGEIGIAFPPTDPKFKGLDSKDIVAHVLAKTAAFGGDIVHLDATLIAEEPKLKPHYEKLKAALAAVFHLPESRVSLKAKSNEGLDAIGRGEAIACHAVATVLAP
ncbi:MAG: 2-C-methyl-D-erythritol 4-phosphate cytidylyltransferase [Elusimicrobiota bacterium]|jgi:2-C-methyl-D-erythritol 4-phosphate cytidylyltransferase/2-C-methyl-D-erythritol 2,4-cyclodiphosphate synthase